MCAVASVMRPFKNVDDNLKFIITIYNSIAVLQKGWLFMQETVVSEWLRRETKLLEEIASALEYYSRHTKRYQFWQRATSVSVMVLSTLAPLVVAGSGVAEGTFGLSRDNLSVAGVIITLILALIEGVRRIFRFEQRWATCYQVKSTIKREREGYRYQRIGLAVGSEEWKLNLAALRKAFDIATGQETQAFFAAVQDAKSAAPAKPV